MAQRAAHRSDLRCYLYWCAERGLDPLTAHRPHLELYTRWMQEIRHVKPSAVSRRFSVTAGFYRTCVIDGLLEDGRAQPSPRGADAMAGTFPRPAPARPWPPRARVRHTRARSARPPRLAAIASGQS